MDSARNSRSFRANSKRQKNEQLFLQQLYLSSIKCNYFSSTPRWIYLTEKCMFTDRTSALKLFLAKEAFKVVLCP